MKSILLPILMATSLPVLAQPDVLPVKQISLELARDIAMGAVEACRKDGYSISAVVLDRAGNLQAALRDTLAARHTLEIAERKAGMSIMSGIDTGEFRAARADIRPELNHIQGLAHNLAVNSSKRVRHEPIGLLQDESVLASGDLNAEEEYLDKEGLSGRRVWISAALRRLTPQERQCLELRAEGLRFREIAEILNVKIPTVQTVLTRAVKKMARPENARVAR